MKIAKAVIASFFLLVFVSYSAHSQDAIPNLVGFWDRVDGQGNGINSRGEFYISQQSLEFTDQNRNAFKGISSWSTEQNDDPAHNVGDQVTRQADEEIIGVFNMDGSTFIAVNHPDGTYLFGTMVGDDRLELIKVESGKFAVAQIAVFERRK